MKYLMMLLCICLAGCYGPYEVTCEEPYYRGHADYVRIDENGINITTSEGVVYIYPPSVKCQAIGTTK